MSNGNVLVRPERRRVLLPRFHPCRPRVEPILHRHANAYGRNQERSFEFHDECGTVPSLIITVEFVLTPSGGMHAPCIPRPDDRRDDWRAFVKARASTRADGLVYFVGDRSNGIMMLAGTSRLSGRRAVFFQWDTS